jgi:hypothetical protein
MKKWGIFGAVVAVIVAVVFLRRKGEENANSASLLDTCSEANLLEKLNNEVS